MDGYLGGGESGTSRILPPFIKPPFGKGSSNGRWKGTKILVSIWPRVTRRDNEGRFAIRHGRRLLLGAPRPPSTPRCQGDSRRRRREVFRRLVCRRRVVTRSPRVETERYFRVCACARVCAVVPRACRRRRRRRSYLYRWTRTAGRYRVTSPVSTTSTQCAPPCPAGPSERVESVVCPPTGECRDILMRRGWGSQKHPRHQFCFVVFRINHACFSLIFPDSVVSKGSRVDGPRVMNILCVTGVFMTPRQQTSPV